MIITTTTTTNNNNNNNILPLTGYGESSRKPRFPCRYPGLSRSSFLLPFLPARQEFHYPQVQAYHGIGSPEKVRKLQN